MSHSETLVVGSRGSALALRQTQLLVETLQGLHPGLAVEIRKITTSGDRIQDRFLSKVGGKGLFVKEIEEALLSKEIDFAVHSLKDLPAELPEGLALGCYPPRLSPRDTLVSREGLELSQLKEGAVVGTSSLRRRSQLGHARKDLRFELLRGNIDTRLRRLSAGDFDAIVLAKAGMIRLGLNLENSVELSMVPAPGQGTLAVEIRQGDDRLKRLLAPLHHEETQIISEAERQISGGLGGNCDLPLGVLGEITGSRLKISVYMGLPEGEPTLALSREGEVHEHRALAKAVLQELWDGGAQKIIDACGAKAHEQ